MSLIAARNLEKSYADKCILDRVSFAIESKDRIGLIGANGSGKTTLLRILLGQEDADNGEILRRRHLSIAVVEQIPKFLDTQTVGDIVAQGLQSHQVVQDQLYAVEAQLGLEADRGGVSDKLSELIDTQATLSAKLEQLGGWNVEHLAKAAMQALSVPPAERQLDTLSLGERRRVALCVALIEAHDLLILDEPTNHLDVQAIDWLEKTIVKYPGAILMVSHDRYLLDRTVQKLFELDRGDLRSYEANYTGYMITQAERYAVESKQEQRRQKAIASELQWARRSAPARTSKQRARLDRLDEIMANKPKSKSLEAQFKIPYPLRISKTILELSNVGHTYGERQLFSDLNLIMKKGDRIGIVGPNGAGKSTLLKIILGELSASEGSVVNGPNTEIIYVDQMRSDLDPELSILDAVGEHGDFVHIGDKAVPIQGFLTGLLFDGPTQRMKVKALSGGERSRAVLAKHLCRSGNLIILDEPTNDLDLPTLRVLENALINYPGCALIVSHDRYFLDRVSTATLAFESDGVRLYEGNYSQYLHLRCKTRDSIPQQSETPAEISTKKPKPKQAKQKRSYREEQEYAQIEHSIMAAETELERLQIQLNDADQLRTLGAKVHDVITELELAQANVEALYRRWEELSQYD